MGLAAIAALAVVLVASVLAEARVYSGSSQANKVAGTKKADKMRLKGGNDRARGRGGADRIFGAAGNDRLRGDRGNDRLVGGRGRDRLHGGRGRDSMAGGAGNDVLNSADGRKDRRVLGGGGRNTCKIDAVDLSITRGCARIVTVGGGTGGTGGMGGTGGDGGDGGTGGLGDPGGDGSPGPLTLTSATGLQCSSPLPTCSYQLSGTGADQPLGTVTGGGGVTTLGGSLALQEESWEALGLYGCSSDGYLRIAIGEETLDVPVDCVTTG